jgi:phage terminase large subunit
MQNLTRSLLALPPKQRLALALVERARRVKQRQQLQPQQPPQPPPFASHSSLLTLEGHPFQDLLKPAPYKSYRGGRDAAKSWAFAEAIIRRMTYSPIRVLCTREFQNSVSDSVHRLLTDTIIRLGLTSWFDVTRDSIRSRVGAYTIYKGLRHNINEIKSLEGVDIAWVEEAQNTSQESLDILDPTIRKEGSELWFSWNVVAEDDPIYKYCVLTPPPGMISHIVNYDQNPYLSKRSAARIAHLKEVDFDSYEHVYMGRAKKLNDSIILAGRYKVEGFSDELWKQAERLLYGADFGFARDPNTLNRAFILGNTLYCDYEAHGVGVELTEMDQFWGSIPEVRNGWPIKCDNARPETISYMKGFGYNASAAEKWKGSVEDGIAHLKGFDKIVIHERCKETAQEARLYSYKKDRMTGEVLPVIVDKWNHHIDGLRYSLDGYIQARGGLGLWEKLAG